MTSPIRFVQIGLQSYCWQAVGVVIRRCQRHARLLPKVLYKGRARIEQAAGKLKRFKRIALRCEKTARNYGSFVALACAFILIKTVHTT